MKPHSPPEHTHVDTQRPGQRVSEPLVRRADGAGEKAEADLHGAAGWPGAQPCPSPSNRKAVCVSPATAHAAPVGASCAPRAGHRGREPGLLLPSLPFQGVQPPRCPLPQSPPLSGPRLPPPGPWDQAPHGLAGAGRQPAPPRPAPTAALPKRSPERGMTSGPRKARSVCTAWSKWPVELQREASSSASRRRCGESPSGRRGLPSLR